MGVSTSAHPRSQALALPPVKDKQRSQPTPSDHMFNVMLYSTYSIGWDIIYADAFRCITSVTEFKFAKFESTE